MNVLYDLSVLLPDVVKCPALNFRAGRNILHSCHGDFFSVGPGQGCRETTICSDQIKVARAIGCERYREALERRAWIERRLRYIQLPGSGERSNMPGLCHKENGGYKQHRDP